MSDLAPVLSAISDLGQKVDNIREDIGEYKTKVAVDITELQGKTKTLEAEKTQLFTFHNENEEKMGDLRRLIDSNAHTVQDLSNNVKNNRIGLDKSREEINQLRDAVREDDTKEATKKDIWKAVVATLTVVAAILASVYPFVSK